MQFSTFVLTSLVRGRLLFGLGLCLTFFIGCADGDPEPAPAAPQPAPAQTAASNAPAEQPVPPEVEAAIKSHAKADTAAKSALATLKAVRSAQDFEAKLPDLKNQLDAILTNMEQARAKVSTLTAEQQQELDRRFAAESEIPSTMQTIAQELTRIGQIQGVSQQILTDFLPFMMQFQQRAAKVLSTPSADLPEGGLSLPVGVPQDSNAPQSKD